MVVVQQEIETPLTREKESEDETVWSEAGTLIIDDDVVENLGRVGEIVVAMESWQRSKNRKENPVRLVVEVAPFRAFLMPKDKKTLSLTDFKQIVKEVAVDCQRLTGLRFPHIERNSGS